MCLGIMESTRCDYDELHMLRNICSIDLRYKGWLCNMPGPNMTLQGINHKSVPHIMFHHTAFGPESPDGMLNLSGCGCDQGHRLPLGHRHRLREHARNLPSLGWIPVADKLV